MGCDFFCAGSHKWMFGPRGTGSGVGHADKWARLRPTFRRSRIGGVHAWIGTAFRRPPTTARGCARAASSPSSTSGPWRPRFGCTGRSEDNGSLHASARLNDQLKAGLAQNRRITLHTPMSGDLSAGLVAFEVAGVTPADVVKQLLARSASSPAPVLMPSATRVSRRAWSIIQRRWRLPCAPCARFPADSQKRD